MELLKEGTLTTAELLLNASLAPFRISYKGVRAPLRRKKISLRGTVSELEARDEQRRFYKFLMNLKRDGLITIDSSNNKKGWFLSKKGRAELEDQPEQKYSKNASKEVVVISYDIPEGHRKDRDWLRSTLRFLDFKMLHQSIWIGKIEIPETLLTDLRERKITGFIHMFTIGKKGSLTQVL